MLKLKRSTYATWSFRLLIYLIVINIASFFIVVNYDKFLTNTDEILRIGRILGIIGNVFFAVGLICTVISIVKKEKRNYLYFVSIIVYPIILLLFLINKIQYSL